MLGAQAAGQLLLQLSQPELQNLTAAFAAMRKIDRSERRKLAEEALVQLQSEAAEPTDLLTFARGILDPVLGPEAVSGMLHGDPRIRDEGTLEWLPDDAAEPLARILGEENPRISAIVLAALRPSLATRVLSMLSAEARGDSVFHLATGRRPTADAVGRVLDAVARQVQDLSSSGDAELSGRAARLALGPSKVVEILRQCDRTTEKAMLEFLEERAPDLAAQVSQSIFSTIADLKWLDAKSLQVALRQVDARDLAKALRGANEEIKRLCFGSLSENAAQSLKEEIESLGPIPRRDVEEAQSAVLDLVRTMIEEGRVHVAQEEDLV
jgi:flagellar motor switch protein FliG